MSNLKEIQTLPVFTEREFRVIEKFAELLVLSNTVGKRQMDFILEQLKPVVNEELKYLKNQKRKTMAERNKKRKAHITLLGAIEAKNDIDKVQLREYIAQLEKELEESNKTILNLKAQIKTLESTIRQLEEELRSQQQTVTHIKKKGFGGQHDDKILELRKAGLSERKIAASIGCSKSFVNKKLREFKESGLL